MTAPVAPWPLSGESLVALVQCGERLADLPAGLAPIGTVALVIASRYDASPVGAYCELAVAQPARLGVRPGWCFTSMVTNSNEARLGGRLNWGFPKELGTLDWISEGDERRLRWVERDLEVHAHVRRVPVPVALPVRALQRRADGPVLVPSVLRGLGRFGTMSIDVPDGDALTPLAGAHRGLDVSSARFTLRPARHPIGLASTLRAPLRAPEPALSLSAPGD